MPEEIRPQPPVPYRWAVLIFISLAMGGNYYIYDSINALERIFIDNLGFSATQFGWLNASYSVAAVATLLVGGIIIDRIGTKKAILAFAVICLLGSIITAARGSAPLMIAGRTVLGLGAESMIVAVTTALAKWFKGKELSFAFGINLTIARLASVAADNSPTWASHAFYPQGPAGQPSWQGPLLIAVGAGVLAVIFSIIYWGLESGAESRYALAQAGTTDKLEFKRNIPLRVVVLAGSGPVLHVLFGDLSLPHLRYRFLYQQTARGPWRYGRRRSRPRCRTEAGRQPEQPAPLGGNDRHSSVRSSRRSRRKACLVHDVRLTAPDAGLLDDGVFEHIALHPSFSDGNRLLADPGCHVAFGGVHRRPVPARDRLCLDDSHPADWLLLAQSSDRQSQRLLPRQPR